MKEKLLEMLKKQLDLLLANKKYRLYQAAVNTLGRDASPDDLADDVVGCAESVSTIMKPIFGNPIILGTATLFQYLIKSPEFQQVMVPESGDIIISPTGMGNGSMQGHVGIVGKNGTIMSNSSATGKFMSNYTIDTWTKRYHDKGGIPVYYFRVK